MAAELTPGVNAAGKGSNHADVIEDDVTPQLVAVESRQLAGVKSALERMKDGQYGICAGCKARIPIARLRAVPHATLCIICQREAEKLEAVLEPALG
jgi:DnaK suppressor protein